MAASNIPWSKIKLEWISNPDNTFAALAEKYGIDLSTISRKSKQEDWPKERKAFSSRVKDQAYARVEAAAVESHVNLYEATREATDNLVAALLAASKDAKALHRHLIQVEQQRGFDKDKWVEDRVMDRIDGRNAADIARAIKDLATLARVLDNKVDAPVQAKLDIEREKLELDKRRAGMGDDIESETGIAIMPWVDQSLLDNALPDPDQPEPEVKKGE